jgi:hypothetical protein
MIRPITCLCFLLACGSGLYLYQSKHRVQLLDREIEDTVRATEKLREQIRVAHAEWTLLNDPQRLQTLADQFLALKTVAPGQFTSMAELDNRLPAVQAPAAAPPPEPEPTPVALGPEATPVEQPKPAALAALGAKQSETPSAASSQAPAQPSKSAEAAPQPPRPPERKPPPRSPAVVAEATAPRPSPVVTEVPRAAPVPSRPIVAAEISRPVVVPARVTSPPPPYTGAAYTGSALGMARSSSVAAPQPMPAPTPWTGGQGGGG